MPPAETGNRTVSGIFLCCHVKSEDEVAFDFAEVFKLIVV